MGAFPDNNAQEILQFVEMCSDELVTEIRSKCSVPEGSQDADEAAGTVLKV